VLKKTITYKDLDDNEVSEDFYFNVNKRELARLEVTSGKQGLTGLLEQLTQTEDGPAAYELIEKVILMAVGRRHADGRQFEKTDEIRNYFAQTNALSELIMEMLGDPQVAAEFFKGIIPAELLDNEAANKSITNLELPAKDEPKKELPEWYTEGRVPTQAELDNAPRELLEEAFRRKMMQDKQPG
jgi:hypothetical protein